MFTNHDYGWIHCHTPVNVNDMSRFAFKDKPRASGIVSGSIFVSQDDPVFSRKASISIGSQPKDRRLKGRWTECLRHGLKR